MLAALSLSLSPLSLSLSLDDKAFSSSGWKPHHEMRCQAQTTPSPLNDYHTLSFKQKSKSKWDSVPRTEPATGETQLGGQPKSLTRLLLLMTLTHGGTNIRSKFGATPGLNCEGACRKLNGRVIHYQQCALLAGTVLDLE